MNHQPELIFNPWTGERLEPPQEIRVEVYRTQGSYPWVYNPWTGERRNDGAIMNDPRGYTIWVADWGPMPAAVDPTPTPAVAAVLEKAKPTKGAMTYAEFEQLLEETVTGLRKHLAVKGPEYSSSDSNRIAQFSREGEWAGVTALQCLFIYMSKHYAAVATFVRDDAKGIDRPRSESIEGRLDDIMNYCLLAKAVIRANSR